MDSHSAKTLAFQLLPQRQLVVQPTAAQMTSDAGLLPLAQFDRQWHFTDRLAQHLVDARKDPQHISLEMLRQRLFGILADYEDCNDHDDLRDDPLFKIIAGRSPDDKPLASQPTLSRFENSITPAMIEQAQQFLVETGIEQLKDASDGQLPETLTLDIDPTDVATHGTQQLTLFHGYYDQHQYFPQLITEPTTQHVFGAHLRHGSAHASLGAEDDLLRVVEPLRSEDSSMAIHVRGDSGFGVPKMYETCEKHGLSYTFGISGNRRLKAQAAALLERAVAQYEETQEKQRLFTVFEYRADSWDRSRTVIAKAECHHAGTNVRFVVTNLWVGSSAHAAQRYDEYVQRGTSEQRNDELKNGLSMDRLSCHRFVANCWRLLLHVHAYNLFNAFRNSPEIPPELRRAQPARWRTRLIKVAARVMCSTRRVLIEVSSGWPYWDALVACANRSWSCCRAP